MFHLLFKGPSLNVVDIYPELMGDEVKGEVLIYLMFPFGVVGKSWISTS